MTSSAEASMGVSDRPGRVATAHGLLITQRCTVAVGNDVSVGLCDVSDGNRDGNDGSHQRPEAAIDSHVLSQNLP